MSEITWVDWTALQERVPEDERQSLDQAFSQLALPADTADTPYKSRAAEDVQATLEALEREGRVKEEDGKILIDKRLIPEPFQKYAG